MSEFSSNDDNRQKDSFEILLEENYQNLNSDLCKKLVKEYVDEHESLKGENIFFIKKLSKVIHNILHTEPSFFRDDLEKLHRYNIEGVEVIRTLDGNEYEDKNLTSIASHFLGYAGEIAYQIYSKNQVEKWAVLCYENNRISARLLQHTNARYSAYTFGYAGSIAKTLYDETNDIRWLYRWYHAKLVSAKVAEDVDTKHASYCYSIAGKAAMQLFEIKKKNLYGTLWHEHYKKSAELAIGNNDKHAAHAYSFAGNAAMKLFINTKETQWAVKWFECYVLSGDLSEKQRYCIRIILIVSQVMQPETITNKLMI